MTCPECGSAITAITAWHGTGCPAGYRPGYHAPDEHPLTSHTCESREWVADGECQRLAWGARRTVATDLAGVNSAVMQLGGYWS
jgi:hypothetical protein